MILLVDNYDSFVYNLRRYLQRLGQEVMVVRNDAVDFQQFECGAYQAVVLSPGPKSPTEAGCCVELVRQFAHCVPMLGVCLGHQAICQALGSRIVRAPRPVHGRTSLIEHDGSRLFIGLPNPFPAARYHSLVAARETIPEELRVTATTESGIVMAVEGLRWPVFGVQFHPESILSLCGYRVLANFLRVAGIKVTDPLPRSDLSNNDLANDQSSSTDCRIVASDIQEDFDVNDDCAPVVLPEAAGRRKS